jgi:hypothetical protein
MSKIIGKVRFDAQTKKINSGTFPLEFDYSSNIEYNEMLKTKNYIEVSKQQSDLLKSSNEKGITMCVIDGKIQEYVEPLEVKLENAKALKNSELSKIYASSETWSCVVQDTAGFIKKEKNWIFTNISTKMQFRYDSGEFFEKKLSSEDIDDIKNQLNDIGWKIFNINIQIKDLISNAKTIEEIQAIDIQKEFSRIEKVITIK